MGGNVIQFPQKSSIDVWLQSIGEILAGSGLVTREEVARIKDRIKERVLSVGGDLWRKDFLLKITADAPNGEFARQVDGIQGVINGLMHEIVVLELKVELLNRELENIDPD